MAKQATVKLKIETNQKEIKALNKEISKFQSELDGVNDSLRAYEKGSKSFTKQEIDAMKKRQKMLKDEIKFNEKRTKEIKEEIGLISSLEKKMADLQEAKRLATSVEEVAKLNAELKETETQLDEVSNSGKGLGESMADMPGILGTITQSVQGLFQLFKANPILLALTLIVGALQQIYNAFVQTEEGANTMSEIFAGLQAITAPFVKLLQNAGKFLVKLFKDPIPALKELGQLLVDNFINRVKGLLNLIPNLGKAITLVFKGKFKEAGKLAVNTLAQISLGVTDVTDKLEDLGDAIDEVATKTKALKKAENDLEKQRRKEDVANAKRLKEVEKLKILRDDESKSIKDRQEANEQITRIQAEALEEEVAIAEEQVRITEQKLALQREGVTQFGTEKEILDELRDVNIELQQVQQDIYGAQAEATTNRIGLLKEEYEQNLSLMETEKERAILFASTEEEKYKINKKLIEDRLALLEKLGLKENQIYKDTLKEASALSNEYITLQRERFNEIAESLKNVFGTETITSIEDGLNKIDEIFDGKFLLGFSDAFDSARIQSSFESMATQIIKDFEKLNNEIGGMTATQLQEELKKINDFATRTSESIQTIYDKAAESSMTRLDNLEGIYKTIAEMEAQSAMDTKEIKLRILEEQTELQNAILLKQLNDGVISIDQYNKKVIELERNTANAKMSIQLEYWEEVKRILDEAEKKQMEALKKLEETNAKTVDNLVSQFDAIGLAIENAFDPTSILAFSESIGKLSEELAELAKDSELTALQITEVAASAATTTGNLLFEMSNQQTQDRLDNELALISEGNNNELNALEDKLNRGLISQSEYDSKKLKLDNDLLIKENKLKERAFNTEKQNDINQAIMNGALAATVNLASIPLPGGAIAAGLVGAMTAVQVGMIKNKQYTPISRQRGGIVPGTGASNRDSVPANLAPGEFVMNAESTRMFQPILDQMNGAGAGDAPSVTPPPLALKEAKAEEPVVKAYVSEVDITETQNRVKDIDNDATF